MSGNSWQVAITDTLRRFDSVDKANPPTEVQIQTADATHRVGRAAARGQACVPTPPTESEAHRRPHKLAVDRAEV